MSKGQPLSLLKGWSWSVEGPSFSVFRGPQHRWRQWIWGQSALGADFEPSRCCAHSLRAGSSSEGQTDHLWPRHTAAAGHGEQGGFRNLDFFIFFLAKKFSHLILKKSASQFYFYDISSELPANYHRYFLKNANFQLFLLNCVRNRQSGYLYAKVSKLRDNR